MVGRPSQRARRVRDDPPGPLRPPTAWRVLEALLEGQEGSGGPPGWQGGVERHFQWARMGREALPEDREGSRGPPKGPGGVKRPSQWVERSFQRAGRGR